MKNRDLKIIVLLIIAPLYSIAQSNSFTLIGKVNPSHNGELVSVAYQSNKESKRDSAVVADGKFVIKGMVSDPTLSYIRMGKVQPANVMDFYLAPGTTTFVTTDSLQYAKISGTAAAEDYVKLMVKMKPLRKQKLGYTLKYYDIPQDQKKTEEAKLLVDKIQSLNTQMIAATNEFIDSHPSSYIALESLKNLSGSTINYAETLPRFEKLDVKIKNTPGGKEFAARIAASKNMAIGSKAPVFESMTPEGKKLSLTDVLATGKYTLIDFWASWCGPCRKENPNVVKAYTTYHDKGLNILSVSLDSKAENWKDAIAKDGMPWYHVSGLQGWKEPIALLYGVEAVPQNILVDAKGVVVAKNLRAEELLKKLGQLL